MPGKLPGPAACRSCFHRFVLPWGLGVDALDKVGGSSCGVGSSFIILQSLEMRLPTMSFLQWLCGREKAPLDHLPLPCMHFFAKSLENPRHTSRTEIMDLRSAVGWALGSATI